MSRKGSFWPGSTKPQSAADVQAQVAALSSAEADAAASEAGYTAGNDNINALQATLDHTKADLERYDEDFKRGQAAVSAGPDRQVGFRTAQGRFRGAAGGGRGSRIRVSSRRAPNSPS